MVAIALVTKFMRDIPHDPLCMWQPERLLDIAGVARPDSLMARNEVVLKADANLLWSRWFIEGLCNPLRYVDDATKTIVDVLSDILGRLNSLYAAEPQDERRELAEKIAQHVMAEVTRRRLLKRISASISQKRELVDASGGEPRCWMCGYKFLSPAVDAFLGKAKTATLELPKFVDVLRPRGLYERDISIEVEHKVPVAGGGGGLDNLALACGWCNKYKGAKTSIYDADSRAPRASFTLGGEIWHELPHPFWTVRLLAVRRRCEHPDGCGAMADKAELYIAPTDPRGAPNPSNLHVYCADHDPYAASRYVGREAARRIWKSRKRG